MNGLDDDGLREAIDFGTLFVTELPGRIELPRVPGVQGWVSRFSEPENNQVALDVSGTRDVERTIRRVCRFFADRGLGFSWLVGVGPPVADLEARLRGAGLVERQESRVLITHDLGMEIPPGPGLRVEEVDAEALLLEIEWIAAAFGTPADQGEPVLEAYAPGRCAVQSRGYLAWHGETAVGFGLLIYVPGRPIAILRYAATREGYGGRGVYRSCLARRMADARADGIETVILNSNPKTSGPICERLGFRQVGRVVRYEAEPPGRPHR